MAKNYLSDGTDDLLTVDKNDPAIDQCEKNTAYLFDTEIQLSFDRRAGATRIMATTRKDRSYVFPKNKQYEWKEDVIRDLFQSVITRKSKPITEEEIDAVSICDDCGKEIEPHGDLTAEATALASRNAFGRPLCRDCRQIEKNKIESSTSNSSISNNTNTTEVPE
jgi:hypothetical protein